MSRDAHGGGLTTGIEASFRVCVSEGNRVSAPQSSTAIAHQPGGAVSPPDPAGAFQAATPAEGPQVQHPCPVQKLLFCNGPPGCLLSVFPLEFVS